jgi:hypothetical protein
LALDGEEVLTVSMARVYGHTENCLREDGVQESAGEENSELAFEKHRLLQVSTLGNRTIKA